MILEKILHNLLLALWLTVIVEASAAFIIGIRNWYGQVVILLTNVITNPLLNSALILVSFYFSTKAYWCVLILLEIAVVFVEGLIFKKMLQLKMNCFLFSLILNACSYFIGMVIFKFI